MCKIWLEKDKKAFGEGPCKLLEKVEKLGSLNQAAKEMGMSYSKAWNIVNRAEEQLGFLILERRTGGTEGGGSLLTKEAKILMKQYKDFYQEAETLLTSLYKKHLQQIFDKEDGHSS
ncbi:LysR family transcriptional regulator [Clostridiaceae bacterium 35-E11]